MYRTNIVVCYLIVHGLQDGLRHVHVEEQDEQQAVVGQLLEVGAVLLVVLQQAARYDAQDLKSGTTWNLVFEEQQNSFKKVLEP